MRWYRGRKGEVSWGKKGFGSVEGRGSVRDSESERGRMRECEMYMYRLHLSTSGRGHTKED